MRNNGRNGRPPPRYQRIGVDPPPAASAAAAARGEEQGIWWYFDIVHGNTAVPALVWSGILIVLVTIIVVAIAVPTYQSSGSSPSGGVTRTYPPSSTSIMTTTSVTTVVPTTTPAPALVLTCPTSDVSVPLGFPLNNVALGGVSLTGGCPPLSLTFTDTLVGIIAKKKKKDARRRTPFSSGPAGAGPATPIKSAQHFFQAPVGRRCGVLSFSRKQEVSFRSRTDPKSPSYPDGRLRIASTLITPNTNAPQANPALDTNINYVVSAVDSEFSGATMHVYTKSLLELSGSPFTLSSLAPMSTVCSGTGAGQAQVLYDTFASIWLFLEPSTSNQTTLCLYASNGPQPLTSSYTLYELGFPALDGAPFGFPKLAAFGEGYYTISFVYNRTSPVLVIVDRASIVAQQLSTSYFVVPPALPDITTMANTTWSPLDNRGQFQVLPNLTTGVYFMRQHDTQGPQDYLDIAEYTAIDFNLGMANMSSYSLQITNFDSSGPSFCIPVPQINGTTLLYAGQEWLGGRLSYNALSPPYLGEFRVVGTFVTTACTGARVQWFELEFDFGTRQWVLRQQGLTPILPGTYLWMPAISQDKYGNILLVFSNSSAADLSYYPSLGAYSRVADDPLNSLRIASGGFVWAPGSAPGPSLSTWGYSSVLVADPASAVGRTFYAMGSYSPSAANVWQAYTAHIVMQGDIVQRNILGQDYCGQTQTCEFFILDGNV